LAAGRSERFRAASGGQHKLQALLGERTVLAHVLAAVQASGLPWHVVEAAHTQHLSLPGMGDSIACGVAATAQASGWLILPADLPLVQTRTLHAVAAALATHAVVVPFFADQRGHPVGFAASCREELLSLQGEGGASAVVTSRGMHRLVVDDPGCVLDVDTPEALQAAQALWQQRMTSPPSP
jgi:molybdenum cofactor cytidylyltransferase